MKRVLELIMSLIATAATYALMHVVHFLWTYSNFSINCRYMYLR